MVRRRVETEVQLRSTSGLFGHRTIGIPDVFADRDGDTNARDLVEMMRARPRRERALFVEHVVVGKETFAIHTVHSTVAAHRSGVVNDRSTRGRVSARTHVDETHDRDAVAGLLGDVVEDGARVAHEAGFQNEVFGWVTGDHQFAEHHYVASGFGRSAIRIEHQSSVADEVADHGVELGQPDAQCRHLAEANGGLVVARARKVVLSRLDSSRSARRSGRTTARFTQRSQLGKGKETDSCEIVLAPYSSGDVPDHHPLEDPWPTKPNTSGSTAPSRRPFFVRRRRSWPTT